MKRHGPIHIPDASLRTTYQWDAQRRIERERILRITVLIIALILSIVFMTWITVSDAGAQTIGEPHSECAPGAACHFSFLPGVMRQP